MHHEVGEFRLRKPEPHDVDALYAWKNDAAGEYQFKQGPGATLVFLNPVDGALLERTDAMKLGLTEKEFLKNEGRTPKLHDKLQEILGKLEPK